MWKCGQNENSYQCFFSHETLIRLEYHGLWVFEMWKCDYLKNVPSMKSTYNYANLFLYFMLNHSEKSRKK